MKALLCGLGAVIGYCAVARPKPAAKPAPGTVAAMLAGAQVSNALMDSSGLVVAFDNGYILRAQSVLVAHLSNPFV